MLSKEEQALRDKLNAYRPPFEAGDWAAMEQMLDAKPKRRILGWWPLGIAALLIGSGSVLGASWMMNRPMDGVEFQENSRPMSTRAYHQNGLTNDKSTPSIGSNNTVSNAANNAIATNIKTVSISRNKALSSNQNPSISKNIYTSANANSYTGSKNIITTNSAKTPTAGAIQEMIQTLNMRGAAISEASSEAPAYVPQKAADENLLITAMKQKPWHWSIGADFGTLVNVNSYRVNDVKKLAIRNFLLSDAGLNVQLSYKNKIGVFSGVKYAKRPAQLEDSLMLNKLAGHKAKEKAGDYLALNIPIGVYVAMYNDKLISVYGKAGINNIINLVQESHYQWVTEESAPPANIAKIGNAQLLASTDNTAIDQVSSPDSKVIRPKTYHLRKTPDNRYSCELYLSAGASVHIGKRCSVNIEPAYMLNLSTLGKPNGTSHNFGLNTGILYRF
jgi:hypothetical protein